MKWPSVVRSFSHAWRGIRLCFRTERSFRIQIVAGTLAITCASVFPLTFAERFAVLFVVTFVLVLELLNSSVERLVDFVKPRFHEFAGDIKDLMAGAVLVASIFSVFVAILIFWPYFLPSLRHV
jgi:diacylglycerol kinase